MTRVGRQIERMASLLKDVERSGGKDRWDHLRSHGHSYATVRSAIDRGYLCEVDRKKYQMTYDARAFFIWHDVWKKTADCQTEVG